MVYDQDEIPSLQQYGFRISPGLVTQVAVTSERVSLLIHTKCTFFSNIFAIREKKCLREFVSMCSKTLFIPSVISVMTNRKYKSGIVFSISETCYIAGSAMMMLYLVCQEV
jgi:hypothetical protein